MMMPMPPAAVDTQFVKTAAVAPTSAAPAAAKPSLFDLVAQKMSAAGAPIFKGYVAQTLLPQVRADQQADRHYRAQLETLVRAPVLDVDATRALIDARKQAEAATAASIRTGAFAMIRTLPVGDRKLALTAIFADARLPAPAQPAATGGK